MVAGTYALAFMFLRIYRDIYKHTRTYIYIDAFNPIFVCAHNKTMANAQRAVELRTMVYNVTHTPRIPGAIQARACMGITWLPGCALFASRRLLEKSASSAERFADTIM